MDDDTCISIEISPDVLIEEGTKILITLDADTFDLRKAHIIFPIGGGWGSHDIPDWVEVTEGIDILAGDPDEETKEEGLD